jgi:hypothetical protein
MRSITVSAQQTHLQLNPHIAPRQARVFSAHGLSAHEQVDLVFLSNRLDLPVLSITADRLSITGTGVKRRVNLSHEQQEIQPMIVDAGTAQV